MCVSERASERERERECVWFMYFVFTRMPGESYRDVFGALINSLVYKYSNDCAISTLRTLKGCALSGLWNMYSKDCNTYTQNILKIC